MTIKFNELSGQNAAKEKAEKKKKGVDPLERAISTGERTRFVHKANPLVDRAYQIFEYDFNKGSYEVVGDYVLINKDEPRDITEKKVVNLLFMLNRKNGDMIDISNLTKGRILYTLVPEARAGDQTKIILKDYDGSGVSKDNAVFTIRKGVFNG